jgi:hypothetical protein
MTAEFNCIHPDEARSAVFTPTPQEVALAQRESSEEQPKWIRVGAGDDGQWVPVPYILTRTAKGLSDRPADRETSRSAR